VISMKKIYKLLLSVMGSLFVTSIAMAQDLSSEGAVIYEEYCEACHQADGVGFEDTYPALKDNVFVLGDKEELIYLLLEGRAGMPTFIEDLEQGQMTTIINYIRNSWGNKADIIEQAQIDQAYELLSEEGDGFGAGN
jgi:cytochrome c6